MSNNPDNCIYGNGTIRLHSTLPVDDGTPLTAVTAATTVATKTAHGLLTGQKVKYDSGTGFSGLTATSVYWVIKLTADTFSLASTLALAKLGTALTLGTSSAGQFTPTGLRALPASYTSLVFGNISKFAPLPKAIVKEHKGSYAGVLAIDKRRRQEKSLAYKIVTDEFPAAVLALIMGAASGAAPDPGAVQTYYGIAYIEQENEPIQADGSAIYNHYGFKCTVSTDGDLPDLDGGESDLSATIMCTVDFSAPGLYTAGTRPIA
jgi:hypothetical protein